MKNAQFKKLLLSALCAALAVMLCGCNIITFGGGSSPTDPGSQQGQEGMSTDYIEATAASDSSVSASETDGEFTITTEDGAFTKDGGAYTVTKAGTYSLAGRLSGQIIVEAGADDEVVLELNGVTIENSSDSPIRILSADKVEIPARQRPKTTIQLARARYQPKPI